LLHASRKYTIFIVIILILNIILFDRRVAFSQEEIKISVLTYHYFYSNPDEVKRYNLKEAISIDSFEKQMEYLYKKDM